MRRALCGLLAAALALGCGASAPPLAPPAEVSVELLGGLAQREPPPVREGERVEVLLDLTTSLRAGDDGIETYAAARSAAARFVRGLPEGEPVRVHALGLTPGRSCESATRLDPHERARSHAELASGIERLEPAGEGSLAVALAELRSGLAAGGELGRSRVVVFSDLGSECGGDVCTAADLLLEAGARIDFVVLGSAPSPACFSALVPADRGQHAQVIRPPRFRIVSYDPDGESAPLVLAEGRADATRRRVPAGPVMIEVALEPPAKIGPLVLSPGAWTRVRVIDFPALDPPVRESATSTVALPAGAGGVP